MSSFDDLLYTKQTSHVSHSPLICRRLVRHGWAGQLYMDNPAKSGTAGTIARVKPPFAATQTGEGPPILSLPLGVAIWPIPVLENQKSIEV